MKRILFLALCALFHGCGCNPLFAQVQINATSGGNVAIGGGSGCQSGGVSGYFLLDAGSGACEDSLGDYGLTASGTATFPVPFNVTPSSTLGGSDNKGAVNFTLTDPLGHFHQNQSSFNVVATENGAAGAENGAADVRLSSINNDPNNIDPKVSIAIETNSVVTPGIPVEEEGNYFPSGTLALDVLAQGNLLLLANGMTPEDFSAAEQGTDQVYIAATNNVQVQGGGVNIEDTSEDAISVGNGLYLQSSENQFQINDFTAGGINIDEGSTGPINIAGPVIDLYSAQGVLLGGSSGIAGALQMVAGAACPTVPANTVQICAPASITPYSVKMPIGQGTGALTDDGTGQLTWSPVTGDLPATVQLSWDSDLTISAGTCAPYVGEDFPGLLLTDAVSITALFDPTTVPGWTVTGPNVYFLSFIGSPGIIEWRLCNPTASDLTGPSSPLLWNVGVAR